jgi:hypothetical protein
MGRRTAVAAILLGALAVLAAGCFGGGSARVRPAAAPTLPATAPTLPATQVSHLLAGWRTRLGSGPRANAALRALVRRQVELSTRRTTASVTAIRFFGGSLQPGVRIELRSDRPALALLELRPLVRSLARQSRRVFVVYQLRDAHGRTVWVAGWSGNEGFVSVPPALDPCQPVDHSRPATVSPPPRCPAHLPRR